MNRDPQGLLPRAAALFADALAENFAGLKDALDEQLAARLSAAAGAEARAQLAKTQQTLATRWAASLPAFLRKLRQELAERGGWPYEQDDDDDGPHTLSLIGDAEVEWDLAASAVAKRFDAAAGETLTELDGRLARLAPADRRGNAAVRSLISGEPIARALQAAIETLSEESGQRHALLTLMAGPLVAATPATFERVNRLLADAGVEPEAARPRQTDGTAAARSAPSADEVMNLLSRLAGQGGGGGGGGIPAGMVAVPAAVLDSLNQLQALDRQLIESGAPVGEPTGGNVLREFRTQPAGQQLPPMEAATIDIVAMLFDFILDDPTVPDSVKALIGRLQIPMLKVAMLDKAFFSNREHPARALLDAVSRAALASGRTLEYGHPLYEQIKRVVNRVLAEFEKDQDIFVTLLAEMRTFIASQDEAAGQLAEQSKQIAERQDQEDEASACAEDAFERVLRDRSDAKLAPAIADFLARAWPKVLQRAHLAGGTQGTPWALAVQTLSDLLWTLAPKPEPDERQRMISKLPELLRRVTAFLDKVGVDAAERSAFLDALVVEHTRIIKPEPRARERRRSKPDAGLAEAPAAADAAEAVGHERVSSAKMAPSVVVTRLYQQNGVEVARVGLQGGARPAAERKPAAAKLARGDWVEFIQDDGSVLRGRLSWVSPQRGIMLFTNPQSAKAISISPEALAHQMKQGLARRVGEEALVDRALGKAMTALAPA